MRPLCSFPLSSQEQRESPRISFEPRSFDRQIRGIARFNRMHARRWSLKLPASVTNRTSERKMLLLRFESSCIHAKAASTRQRSSRLLTHHGARWTQKEQGSLMIFQGSSGSTTQKNHQELASRRVSYRAYRLAAVCTVDHERNGKIRWARV